MEHVGTILIVHYRMSEYKELFSSKHDKYLPPSDKQKKYYYHSPSAGWIFIIYFIYNCPRWILMYKDVNSMLFRFYAAHFLFYFPTPRLMGCGTNNTALWGICG